MLENPEYQKALQDRLIKGEANPSIETLLYHYGYGKPADTLNVQGNVGNRTLNLIQVLKDVPDEVVAQMAEAVRAAQKALVAGEE